ncbi:MAG TPA: SDR family NAD(P)-dependent oxidoreductase, partial [Bryobacteraceae bacterium]|nr:SDR family NAD(P)-dependent oxidoreductase [Bryobacteraceae bacterium]
MRPVVIVTGASRGIGAACARLLARSGNDIAISYLKDQNAAAGVVRDCVAEGARATAIQADVSKEADILHLFQTAERELGLLRALVNNAGITGGFSRVDSIQGATLAEVLAVNVTGTILCAREAVKRLSTRHGGRGGAIVNISSIVARTGGAGEWV